MKVSVVKVSLAAILAAAAVPAFAVEQPPPAAPEKEQFQCKNEDNILDAPDSVENAAEKTESALEKLLGSGVCEEESRNTVHRTICEE